MLALLLLALVVASFAAGYGLHARRSVSYKKRWKEVSAAYERAVLDEQKPQQIIALRPKDQKGPQDAQRVLNAIKQNKDRDRLKQIHKMSHYDRYGAEGARLDNKLPVIDDLAGMSSYWTAEMLKRRAQHGID